MNKTMLRKRALAAKSVGARRRFTTVSIPLNPADDLAVREAAAAEGESLTEFLLGGACLLVSRDLAVVEKLLAGFSLNGSEAKLLTRLFGLRKAAERERTELNKIMSGLLKARRDSHRAHTGKL